MAMTACYSNYGLLGAQRQQRQSHQTHPHPAQQILSIPLPQTSRIQTPQIAQKDFSIPLHVDCSVEYELPNQAKPPPGARVEPLLLMIHPCYFRKIESEQRRSPFINNMPNSSRTSSSSTSSTSAAVAAAASLSSSHHTSSSSAVRRVRNTVVTQVPTLAYASTAPTSMHPSHSATDSHRKAKIEHPQIIQRTIHHTSSQHISSRERQKLAVAAVAAAATAEMRSLAQQTQQQQQKMSQMSQQAYYPANNNNSSNNNLSNNTIFSSNITNNSTLAGVQLCLDNWENVSDPFNYFFSLSY